MRPLDWDRRFLPNYFGRFGPADFHATLDADLHDLHQRRGEKRSYIAPRGGAKSTVVTLAYVLRCAVEAWEPYTIVLSDSSEQANELLRHIKSELLTNEFLTDVYPESCGQGPEWKEQRIRLRNGAVVEALGTGKKIRGRRNRAERPSLVVFDDIQSNEDIVSPTLRERAWDWATREVLPAGDERTNFLAVGSALHREAVSVRLGTLAGWHGRTFPAIHSWPARMDLWDEFVRLACNTADPEKTATARAYYVERREEMDAGARTYWPSRWDLPALITRRAEIGSRGFEGEYQGVPSSGEGSFFRGLERIAILPVAPNPEHYTKRVRSYDLASTEAQSGNDPDWTVGVLMGKHKNGEFHVLDMVRARVGPGAVRALIRQTAERDGKTVPVRLEREGGASGKLAAHSIVMNELAGWDARAVSPKGGKAERAEPWGAQIEVGNVAIVRADWNAAFMEEHREFPNGSHDDIIDGVSQAFHELTGGVGFAMAGGR